MFDIRLQCCGTVVLLDRSRWACLIGVLMCNAGNRGRTVQAKGCPERVSWDFLRYVWSFRRRYRPKRFVRLRSRSTSADFLVNARFPGASEDEVS